ncbi:prenyltransferase/squalene oxidase repeat-containing protein [Streptomyces sp. NPDC049040]|uniref:prenyltransferase/squalene oxidase repeat-containing protein n=1 Tax=Streptomyces sp. NPDC049040 TaxID=3365593 RepID=UPI0037234E0B
MPLRRRAALVLAAVTSLTALTAPLALADTTPQAATGTAQAPAPPSRGDLYGTADPTYDGVWRQAYAEKAISTSGYVVGAAATRWLLAQQCADGGWPSYRADTAKACDPKTEDTNATGMALNALVVVRGAGTSEALERGQAWLRTVQNADGGWSYNPGGASDPDSTAIALGALGKDAAGTPNAKGKTSYAALRGFQFGCAAKAADRGAFGYPGTDGKLKANAKATADAINGLVQGHLTGYTYDKPSTTTPAAAPKPADCDTDAKAYDSLDANGAANAAADWLVAQLRAGGGHLNAVTPGADTPTPDYGTTADAVAALDGIGRSADAKAAADWLAADSAAWSKGNPAALAQLIMAGAGRTGAVDGPLQQLIALGPAATKRATGAMPGAEEKKDDSSSGSTTWIVVGVVFVASAGVGLLISGRKRRQG